MAGPSQGNQVHDELGPFQLRFSRHYRKAEIEGIGDNGRQLPHAEANGSEASGAVFFHLLPEYINEALGNGHLVHQKPFRPSLISPG